MIHPYILFEKESSSLARYPLDVQSAPTIFTGQRIRGTLNFSHYDAQEPVFDTIQLVLRGQVINIVKLKGGKSWKIDKPLIRMSCVRKAEDFHQEAIEGSNLVTSQSRFFFDMPESMMLPSLFNGTNPKATFHQLPPSIRVVKEDSKEWRLAGQSPIAGVCDVTYYIEALFSLKGKAVCEVRREIIVMPVAEQPPPMEPEDLNKEYQLFSSSTLGTFWRRKKAMTISISSLEPRPLVFGGSKRKSRIPGTQLQLKFSTRRLLSSNSMENFAQPQIADCELTITLEATTYFLEHEEDSVMSFAEARKSPFAVVKTARFNMQRRKFRMLNWKRGAEVTCNGDRFIDWTATASVTALIPPDAPRLPSFFSPLVSRRYAFEVQSKLSAESGNCSHKPLKLKVPVQMVHATLRKDFNGPPDGDDFEEDELKAPAYVA